MIGNKRIENGNFYFYYQNDKYYGYAYINFMRYTNILEPTKEEITIYNGLINNNPIQSGYNSIDGLFINYPHKLDKGLSKWHNYNRLYSGSNCILKNQNKSNIYKIIFDDDLEDETNKLFKPKYLFGLSDFDLYMIRMYIYLVIIYRLIYII